MKVEHPFRPALFRFLKDLAANNDRDWFQAHKDEYEDAVRGPAMEFIAACAPLLHKISPHFRADPRPQGGSMFRIHRDTRFSKDKSPYKTHTGIQFRHEAGKDAHAPGFYLHLEPGRVFCGLGSWRPDTATAGAYRQAILDDPAGWKKATRSKAFARFELEGESLKRPPRGVDAEHPLIEDLKRKDFIAVTQLEQSDVTGKDFAKEFMALCKTGAPYMRFLCKAVDVPF